MAAQKTEDREAGQGTTTDPIGSDPAIGGRATDRPNPGTGADQDLLWPPATIDVDPIQDRHLKAEDVVSAGPPQPEDKPAGGPTEDDQAEYPDEDSEPGEGDEDLASYTMLGAQSADKLTDWKGKDVGKPI